jgi:hypothetical protein
VRQCLLQAELRQQRLQTLGRAALLLAGVARNDQLVLHAVLPADQLGHGDLVATGFQVQAAQHIGELAADLARVDGMAPEFCQRRARQAQGLVLTQAGGDLGLAAGNDHHGPGLLLQAEGDGVVGGGITGMQGRDHVELRGHGSGMRGLGHRHVEKSHALEAQVCSQLLRCLDQRCARLYAVDAAAPQRLEIQVVEDEAQIRLARAMVGQRDRMALDGQLLQDGCDELVQVVDLLELATRVLVDPAFAREDVQGLEQVQRLAWLEVQLLRHVLLGTGLRPGGAALHWALSSLPACATGQRAPTPRSSHPSMPIFSSVSMLCS